MKLLFIDKPSRIKISGNNQEIIRFFFKAIWIFTAQFRTKSNLSWVQGVTLDNHLHLNLQIVV